MTTVEVEYTVIRSVLERMYGLVRRTIAGSERTTLQTAIYHDLGVLGLDWDEFLVEYEKEFNCQMVGLTYEDYFDNEGVALKDLWKLPVILVWLLFITLPAWILRLDTQKLKHPWSMPDKPRLTIGDLVVSVILKRFEKRENIKITIKKSGC